MGFEDFDDPLLNQGRRSLQKLAGEKEDITGYEIRTESSSDDKYVQILFKMENNSREYQIIVDVLECDERSDYHVNGNAWNNFPDEGHSHSKGDTSTLNRIYGTILEEYDLITDQEALNVQ